MLIALLLSSKVLAIAAAHKVDAVIAYLVFAAIVDSMPAPTDQSSVAYRWFFGFSHTLKGGLITAVRTFFPRFAPLLPKQ